MDPRVRGAYYWFLMPETTIFQEDWNFEYVEEYLYRPNKRYGLDRIKDYIRNRLKMKRFGMWDDGLSCKRNIL